jgi:hypothetical protein
VATEGLLRETAIVVKASDEVTMTAIATAAWRVGSVLISKAYFMPVLDGKGGKFSENLEKCAG